VKVTLRLPRRATYADYLAAEQHSARRYELLDGVIVALPGGSDEHHAIAARFAGLLGASTSWPSARKASTVRRGKFSFA